MHGPRGVVQGPRGVHGPWGGAWWRPPGTATAAGGMHPTGMHSCSVKLILTALWSSHMRFTQLLRLRR